MVGASYTTATGTENWKTVCPYCGSTDICCEPSFAGSAVLSYECYSCGAKDFSPNMILASGLLLEETATEPLEDMIRRIVREELGRGQKEQPGSPLPIDLLPLPPTHCLGCGDD